MTLHRHGGKDWESDSACALCERDALRSRLAEAEALLREVNALVMFTTGQKVIGGTLGKRIDAFLAADQSAG